MTMEVFSQTNSQTIQGKDPDACTDDSLMVVDVAVVHTKYQRLQLGTVSNDGIKVNQQ